MNVAIQYADRLEDEELVPILRTFVQSKVDWACLWFCVPVRGGSLIRDEKKKNTGQVGDIQSSVP